MWLTQYCCKIMFCTLVTLTTLVWEAEVCSCHCGHFQNNYPYVHWCKILNKILKYWIQKTSQRIYPKWWRFFFSSNISWGVSIPSILLSSCPLFLPSGSNPFLSLSRKTNKQTNKHTKIHRLTNWQICPQKAKVKVIIYFKRTGAGISICTSQILVSNFWSIFGQFCVKHFAGCW